MARCSLQEISLERQNRYAPFEPVKSNLIFLTGYQRYQTRPSLEPKTIPSGFSCWNT